MKKASNTDWDKLAKMKDHEIDTSDIAELDALVSETRLQWKQTLDAERTANSITGGGVSARGL